MGYVPEHLHYTNQDQPASAAQPEFPDAPHGWSKEEAAQGAAELLGVPLTEDHWDVVRSLQAYFATHEFPNRRELADALDEKYHHKGGRRYLYLLFPNGPVSQGCQLAGLEAPSGSVDKSFGSVV